MAESEGFEPSEQFYPLTRLAIVRLQPLGQLSDCQLPLPEIMRPGDNPAANSLAEEVGFEPTEQVSPLNGFQDRRLKPLGHSSNGPNLTG